MSYSAHIDARNAGQRRGSERAEQILNTMSPKDLHSSSLYDDAKAGFELDAAADPSVKDSAALRKIYVESAMGEFNLRAKLLLKLTPRPAGQ